MKKYLVFCAISTILIGQETEVIKKTDIYLQPGLEKSVVGQLMPGATVTKLKRDKSGQYIRATVEFYIPMESLLEGRISKKIGESQVADNALFKLISAKKAG